MARIEVESDVTGNVWKVEVEAGAAVGKGDVLIVIESMKMEIPVESPAAGRVAELLVAVEQPVEEMQVLAVIETD